MYQTTSTTVPARRLALEWALQFHRGADTDDPQTVLDTAEVFLTWLRGDDGVG